MTSTEYQRETYEGLLRHEVIAPSVRNDGSVSGYPDALGARLADNGVNWTAVDTVGCWNGKIEPGRQFTIFAQRAQALTDREGNYWFCNNVAEFLGALARSVMPDQDAIQVVVDCPVRLIEA